MQMAFAGPLVRVLLLALCAAAGPVLAQAYPSKPVRLVVPFSPGGQSDVVGRFVAQGLSETWKQPVVVENRPGGTTTVGIEYGSRQPADGYTLILAAPPFVITQFVYPKLGYDPARDFAPASLVQFSPLVLVTAAAFRLKDIAELVSIAKARPGMSYASVGNGSTPHLAGELLKLQNGVDLIHVPYKSGGPAITDLIGGQTSIYFGPTSEVIPHIRSGKLLAVAVLSDRRFTLLPNVPTSAEMGFPNLNAVSWTIIMLAAGTPRDIVAKVSRDIAGFVTKPEMRERLLSLGAEAVGSTPEAAAEFLRAEHAKWGPLVKAAAIKVD